MYYDRIQTYIKTQTQSQGFVKTIALPHKTHVENRNKLLDHKDRDSVSKKLEVSLPALFNKQDKIQNRPKG